MTDKQRDLVVLDEMVRAGATMYFKAPTPETKAELEVQENDPKYQWSPAALVPINEEFKKAIRNSVRVVAPNLEWPQTTSWEDNLFESVGPQSLPYSDMWIEYLLSDALDREDPVWVGAYVSASEHAGSSLPKLTDGGQVYATVYFIKTSVGIACMDVGTMSHVDASGNLMEIQVVDYEYSKQLKREVVDGRWQRFDEDGNPRDWEAPQLSGSREKEGLVLAYSVHATIGLMNCKNVTTLLHERPTKQPKKSRRKRPDRLDYHTIVLPRARVGSGGEGPGDGSAPMHKVRGHFKNYTAEKPLLGKHTGTYWWGWQVRGKKENGEIVSDYKVEPTT